jgi:hypothetical protein
MVVQIQLSGIPHRNFIHFIGLAYIPAHKVQGIINIISVCTVVCMLPSPSSSACYQHHPRLLATIVAFVCMVPSSSSSCSGHHHLRLHATITIFVFMLPSPSSSECYHHHRRRHATIIIFVCMLPIASSSACYHHRITNLGATISNLVLLLASTTLLLNTFLEYLCSVRD